MVKVKYHLNPVSIQNYIICYKSSNQITRVEFGLSVDYRISVQKPVYSSVLDKDFFFQK